jgi:hypothetical protein
MSRARFMGFVLAVTILPATGCGGSSGSPPLTRSQLIAKADPICARVNAKFKTITDNTQAELADVAPGIAAAEQQAATELANLTPPSSMAKNWTVIVNDFQIVAADVRKLSEDAKANNVKGETPSIASLTTAQHERAVAAGHSGFKDCANF